MPSLKETGIVSFTTILFLTSIKFFQNFPFEKEFFIFQAAFILALIAFSIFYVFRNFYTNQRLIPYTLYLIFISFFFPLFSAFRSAIVFGQPPVYGLLRERTWVMVITGVLIIYNVARNKWTVRQLQRAFHLLAWGSLALFFYIYLFLDPGQYDQSFAAIVKFKGVHYTLNPYFISFGLISYFSNFVSDRKIVSLIKFFPFIAYIVFFDKGRGLLVCVLLIMIILIIFRSRYRLKDMFVFSLILVIFIMSMLIFFPHISQMTGNAFQDVFKSLTFNSITLQDSVTARVYQLNKVYNFIGENPDVLLWGAGSLSQQWSKGFAGKFIYFYPLISVYWGFSFYMVFWVLSLWCSVLNMSSTGETDQMRIMVIFSPHYNFS